MKYQQRFPVCRPLDLRTRRGEERRGEGRGGEGRGGEGRGGEGRGGEGRGGREGGREGGSEGGREGGEGEGGMTVIHILICTSNSNPMIPQYLNNNLT